MTNVAASPRGAIFWATWVLKALLAAAFTAAAFLKLSSQPMMVTEFDAIGLGQGFRYLTGAIEILCVGLLLWPRTALFGALGLVGVCIGATVAQLGPLHGDVIHCFVLGGLAALVAWLSYRR